MADTILVTGGAGRLARALVRARPDAITAPVRAAFGIAERDSVIAGLDRLRPVAVINTAAFARVDLAESHVADAERDNVRGVDILARACAARGTPLIHISTDLVFGDGGPWREDDTPAPINVYGRTKLEGERAVQAAGGVATIARIAWLFGHDGDFVQRMLALGAERDSVSAVDDQTGSPTPEGALALRLLELADRLIAGVSAPPVLHICGAPPATRYEWAKTAFDAARDAGARLGRLEPASSDMFPTPAQRPGNSALDTSRATAFFGAPIDWRPTAEAVGRAWAQRD